MTNLRFNTWLGGSVKAYYSRVLSDFTPSYNFTRCWPTGGIWYDEWTISYVMISLVNSKIIAEVSHTLFSWFFRLSDSNVCFNQIKSMQPQAKKQYQPDKQGRFKSNGICFPKQTSISFCYFVWRQGIYPMKKIIPAQNFFPKFTPSKFLEENIGGHDIFGILHFGFCYGTCHSGTCLVCAEQTISYYVLLLDLSNYQGGIQNQFQHKFLVIWAPLMPTTVLVTRIQWIRTTSNEYDL